MTGLFENTALLLITRSDSEAQSVAATKQEKMSQTTSLLLNLVVQHERGESIPAGRERSSSPS